MSAPGYHTAAELDPQIASALLQWGLSLADTKQRMGQRLSEWAFGGAPALEAAVGSSAMTQDELGHARSLFSMLRACPGAPPELGTETDLEDRSEYFSPRLLDQTWESWLDVIAFNVLLDRALALVFESLRYSQFAPLQQRAGKVLQEERFHRVFGDSWLARLAQRNDLQQRLRESINNAWLLTFEWFGPPDEPIVDSLCSAAVLAASMTTIRSQWLHQVDALLTPHGLLPSASEPDWSQWDPLRRDLPH